MPEDEKDDLKAKGRLWEQKRDCSYCHKTHSGEDLGFVHRNKEGNDDWSICFWCTKEFFDRVLDIHTEVKELADKPINKCIYCKTNDSAYLANSDINGVLRWFICFDCLKKAFDKILEGKNGIQEGA